MNTKSQSVELSTGRQVTRDTEGAVTSSNGALVARISAVPQLTYNPLMLEYKGESAPIVVSPHKRSAKTANLFFEYGQNQRRFKGKGVRGEHIAEFLESLDLIEWNRKADFYVWKIDPLTLVEFLRLFPNPGQTTQEG